jgi:hypothetical protein
MNIPDPQHCFLLRYGTHIIHFYGPGGCERRSERIMPSGQLTVCLKRAVVRPMRIRIRLRNQVLMTKKLKKITASKISFNQKLQFTYSGPPYWTSEVHEKPPALKREHPAFQNMKFLHFFCFWGVIFAHPGS